jgi:N-acetylglucosaminyldiphosphoundecaprenol N-acetyl-beta-D-mannosaminyltransferase
LKALAAQSDTIDLFGYRVSGRGIAGDVGFATMALNAGSRPFVVACANPHSLVVASRDGEFRDALQDADLLLPDGSGLILAAKILKLPLTQKVAGTDFFLNFCRYAACERREIRFFFLGATPFVLERIIARLHVDLPSITVAGAYSPPFKDVFTADDNAVMIEAINRSAADVLWVGMTAPKQEKWIWQNRDALNVRLAGAIGAVFDFYAGTKKRSSQFWLNHNLEWLPRLLKEPRRLWARNFKSTPIFLSWIARERLRQILLRVR